MLNSGERQVATQRQDVRADHVARYEWAAKTLPANSYVIDLGCGIGYGAQILAEAGHKVFAVDRDIETITFARTHFAHPNTQFVAGDVAGLALPKADAAVCFEMIEHVADPAPMLAKIADAAPILLASVPNETAFPWREEYAFHHRHYTRDQLNDMLRSAGFQFHWEGGQVGPVDPVEAIPNGRTLIVEAHRAETDAMTEAGFNRRKRVQAATHVPPLLDNQMTEDAVRAAPLPTFDGARERISPPDHVVIIGLGPSAEQYMDLCKRLGGRKRFADEVWAINALGDVLACDRIFHMDDVRVQEARANEAPNSNIAEMVKWLKLHPGPIITSRAHPDYPGLVEFPLEAVINDLGFAYFNGTAAYAAAYAIWLGVKKISLFGCDFTMANAHHAEKGRACLEFWLGVASARGIELGFADRTSLMDTCDDPADPGEIRPYGYDYDRVLIRTEDGAARISFEPKEAPPTAAEIEARYDHTAHPNPLVKPAAGA
jgi:SAM-dependent methyltransferase